jgi:hypothetical protein
VFGEPKFIGVSRLIGGTEVYEEVVDGKLSTVRRTHVHTFRNGEHERSEYVETVEPAGSPVPPREDGAAGAA